ncbi:MAG: hypothetical protein NW203_06230 [Hyphomonadaceae bacterium]|nr:hypothetical protein [Hyphomonadaceae bacterium]
MFFRTVLKPLLAALAVLSAAATPGLAHAQSGYPLVCNGGGGMRLQIATLSTAQTSFNLVFSKAPGAAGTANPLPAGTCAWVDRPLNAAEANVMQWRLNAQVAVEFPAQGGQPIFTSVTGGPDKPLAELFLAYARSRQYFTATAYSDPGGFLAVTAFRGGR